MLNIEAVLQESAKSQQHGKHYDALDAKIGEFLNSVDLVFATFELILQTYFD